MGGTVSSGKRVAVVGGGPSGMTAALLLARAALGSHWLSPFLADCSARDIAKLGAAFVQHRLGTRAYRDVSVADFLASNRLSEGCRAWMRATALGGVTGTLDMTMWELFHRLGSNLNCLFLGGNGALHWNAHPQNSTEGFVSAWRRALDEEGVEVRTRTAVVGLSGGIDVETSGGERETFDAVFLAVPPRAIARVLAASPTLAGGFGHDVHGLETLLRESAYEHYGLAWTFDRDLPQDLPLGGHNVRRGWHPILVQHSQYRRYLRPPAVTAVLASVSLDTDVLHPRLGTRARDHAPEDLARILWEDERLVDPTLPEPLSTHLYGLSNATQIVRHGPLPIKSSRAEVYVATNLNGHAPYFTASLESAIQAGNAAAIAFDPRVERLPT